MGRHPGGFMKKRFIALLLALTAAFCLMSAPPAAADDGLIGNGVEVACQVGAGPVLGAIIDGVGRVGGEDLCDKVGDAVEKKVKEEWKAVWDSVLGDVIDSARDVVKWLLKKMLTVALLGPSLNLEDTGLFGKDATLAGMLVWLGWVIATFGLMWQLGKMAVTGQVKYAGQALLGWVQNALLTGIGLTIVATLLTLGDAMTTGLVDKTFASDGEAYERIIAVMIPGGISNPVMVFGVVAVLLIVGFIQMVMVFLRQSAIPIQCLLLPIAGAGRVGGEATRQWAPRLITSICVVIAYKPILALIICTGFAEFGHSATLSEWLRGLATLVLGVLAPGPLTRLFAPLGAEMGAGLASGGAIGAAANVGSFIEQRRSNSGGGSDDDGRSEPTNAVEHARYVEQSMGSYNQNGQGQDAGGGDAAAQAARNEAGSKVPNPAGAADATTAGGAGAEAGATAGAGVGAGVDGAAGAAGSAGIAIQVLDGVNDTLQQGANQLGDGGNKL
jgi:type IV secretion system protein TrbL